MAPMRLVRAFGERGLVLMGAHTHRFYPYGRAIKAAIDGGDIGRPVYVRLAILGGWIWPDWRAWVLDPRRSGGHVLHNGVHLLDLATWWIGDAPRIIYVQGRKETSADLAIDDYLSMMVRFRGGAHRGVRDEPRQPAAHVRLSRRVRAGHARRAAAAVGRRAGMAFLEGGTSLLPGNGQTGLRSGGGAWVAAIRGETAPAVTGAEARLAVAMAVAGEESLRSGGVVRIESAHAD